jgi:hypothetical protein
MQERTLQANPSFCQKRRQAAEQTVEADNLVGRDSLEPRKVTSGHLVRKRLREMKNAFRNVRLIRDDEG